MLATHMHTTSVVHMPERTGGAYQCTWPGQVQKKRVSLITRGALVAVREWIVHSCRTAFKLHTAAGQALDVAKRKISCDCIPNRKEVCLWLELAKQPASVLQISAESRKGGTEGGGGRDSACVVGDG